MQLMKLSARASAALKKCCGRSLIMKDSVVIAVNRIVPFNPLKKNATLWSISNGGGVICNRVQLRLIGTLPSNRSPKSFSTDLNRTDNASSCELRAKAETSKSSVNEVEQMQAERAEHYKKTWRTMKYTTIFIGVIFIMGASLFVYACGTPKHDDFGNVIIDQYSDLPVLQQLFKRASNEFWLFVRSVPEPSRDVLLPDPMKEPYYQPKYTVVFEISGVLVHPDWTIGTGWRFQKRPAIEYFLKSLGYPRTELVVYTREQGMTAHPIIESLDTENVIMYKLYRDTTKYKDGTHIKDLGKLNRDLSKVIYVDWDTNAFQLNPENALRIPKWSGDGDDTGLIDLANLIRTIVDSDVQDVRPVLQYYSSCPDAIAEFRDKERKLLELEQSKEKLMHKNDESLTKNWRGSLFGYRRHT